MEIFSFQTPYMRSMTYILSENAHAVWIDPCDLPQTRAYIAAQGLTVDMVLLTHEHYDHISGIDRVQEKGVPVVAGEACAKNLQDVRMNHSKFYKAFCSVQERLKDDPIPDVTAQRFHADQVFSGELTLSWQGHSLFLFPTPGHSQGSVCILLDSDTLFAGDTLLWDAGPEAEILGGSMEQYESIALPRLRQLSPKISVYPGHGQTFPLGEHPAIKNGAATSKEAV